jgi:hypothetical protein
MNVIELGIEIKGNNLYCWKHWLYRDSTEFGIITDVNAVQLKRFFKSIHSAEFGIEIEVNDIQS